MPAFPEHIAWSDEHARRILLPACNAGNHSSCAAEQCLVEILLQLKRQLPNSPFKLLFWYKMFIFVCADFKTSCVSFPDMSERVFNGDCLKNWGYELHRYQRPEMGIAIGGRLGGCSIPTIGGYCTGGWSIVRVIGSGTNT